METVSSYLDSHFNQNFSIHEVGMKLIPEHNSKIKKKLELLESKTPAYSTINLRFTGENDQVHGELTIFGTIPKFKASCTGLDPIEIYHQLEKEIEMQLLKWKKSRSLGNFICPTNLANYEALKGGKTL